MGGGSAAVSGPLPFGYVPPKKTTLLGDPKTLSDATAKQSNDYDTIMANYSKLFNSSPIAPVQYSPSQDTTASLANLNSLATTGGYSDQNISDLRARGVAPVRSIYANAKASLDRNKVVQGGYDPGYAGSVAKMARDQSNEESTALTNVNAGIAQNVASNRLAAASPYASEAETEAGRGVDISKFNTSLQSDDLSRKLAATEGMRSIYGTTPALASTFGNQVAQSAQLGQGQEQINNNRNIGYLNAVRGFGG